MSAELRAIVDACWASAGDPSHEQIIRDVLAKDPHNAIACEGAALLAWRRGDFRECYRFASQASQGGGGGPANYLYGMAAAALQRTDEAIAALRRAYQAMPDHVDSVLRLGGLLVAQSDARAREFFGEVFIAAAVARNSALVRAVADEGLKFWPNDPIMRFWQAWSIFCSDASRTANTAQVVKLCEEILADAPGLAEARHLLGRALNCHVRHEEAAAMLAQAADERPDNADYQSWAGVLAFQMERFPQAEKYLRRALELDPSLEDAKNYLSKVPQGKPVAARKRIFGRFPPQVADFANLERIIRTDLVRDIKVPQPLLTPQSRVLAMGSCFATNMARVLSGLGVTASSIGLTEYINSTFANRLFMEWLAGDTDLDQANIDVLMKVLSSTSREVFAEYFRAAEVMIYTLGVAPCFFDSTTGAFKLADDAQWVSHRAGEMTFRTSTVEENVDNLKAIVDIARRLNPDITCVFSVSPVPLKATFERNSAIAADCLSKSVLRVAIEQFLSSKPANSYYWPSFEIFRWAGCYTPEPLFGTEDGASNHVSEATVDMVMRVFIDLFGDEALRAASARKAAAAS